MKTLNNHNYNHPAFYNKRFVISGVFDAFSREEIINEIEKLGGILVTSISSKTDYLVAGKALDHQKR